MKLRSIVVAAAIALSTQTVNADCETAQSIGATGGGATGAFVGGTLGVPQVV